MNIEIRRLLKRRQSPIALCLCLIILCISSKAFAQQQEEVFTFKGQGDEPIKVINEKGEVTEEVSKKDLKRFIVAPKWSIPKELEDPPEQKPIRNATQSESKKPNKTIDEMLKLRKKKFRTSTVRANRPPKKRK